MREGASSLGGGSASRGVRRVIRWRRRLPHLLVGLAVVAGAVVWALGMWLYMSHDRMELLDLSAVSDRAEAACARLAADLEHLRTDDASEQAGPAATRAERIAAENAAVIRLVAAVRDLGRDTLDDDRPAEAWLDDWEALVELRAGYAEDLAASTAAGPPPRIPTDDGVSITRRMIDVGIDCDVPKAITDDFHS